MLMLIRSRSKFMVVDSENNTNASPTKHNVINIRYFYILNNYLYLIQNIFFKKKKKNNCT